MDQIIAFLTSLSEEAHDKWTTQTYVVSRIQEDCYKDTQATFDIETKDYHYCDMSANAQPMDSRIHRNEFQKNSSFISIGFLKKPFDEGMTQLYVAAHTERNNINPNEFEWLICYPTDRTVPNSITVKSGHGLEDLLTSYTSTQILSLISMLKLDLDFEEMREGLNYQEIEMRDNTTQVDTGAPKTEAASIPEQLVVTDSKPAEINSPSGHDKMFNQVVPNKTNRFLSAERFEQDVPNDDPYHVDNLVIETGIEPVPFCYD